MIVMSRAQIDEAALMRSKGYSLGFLCKHFGIGRNNLNRHLIGHPMLAGTRLEVGPRAALMATFHSDEKPTPAQLASIELRRQNILYLLELKRQNYSPSRTEYLIPPDRPAFRTTTPAPVNSSFMTSPAAACAL